LLLCAEPHGQAARLRTRAMSAFMRSRRSSPSPPHFAGVKRRCGCSDCRRALLASATQPATPLRSSRTPAGEIRGAPNAHAMMRDFTQLPVSARREARNGNADADTLESVNDGPRGGGTQPAPGAHPTGTRVDTVTSYTQAALQAGYLSGLGIIARMQVLPDSTSWDGNEVVEAVQQTLAFPDRRLDAWTRRATRAAGHAQPLLRYPHIAVGTGELPARCHAQS